ncbi:lipopolysaccharide biosynthesis protein [Nocardioides sp.]|uniref:lipopolysaccharide biosynthesis protein n=1 Tax=Nocardioides sp. TaxID=35761 RepID=UPI003529A9C0
MTPGTGFRNVLRSGSVVAVAMAVMNVSTYGFQLVAARLLGPQPYGALAALMNVLLVIMVLQLGLQATAARRISADPGQVHQIERVVLSVTYRSALGLGAVLLMLSPLIDRLLRLESVPTAALIAISAVPLTVMGGQAGILQGERRWRPLAAIYVAAGLPRLVVGVALMLVSPTEAVAMLGVAIAAFAPAIVGWWGLREARRDDGELDAEHRPANIIRETLHNSQALFAFFALSSVDVIVARNVLDPHDAGLYAGGLILTKATLFLPQFIVVVAFPALSTEQDRRHALTRSLTLLAVLGAAVTAGVWLMPDLALVFIGGHEFAAIADRLWLFAVIGMLLSALQLLVYAVLARRGQRSAYLLWAGLAALVGLGLGTHTINGLIAVVVAVDGALLAMLVVISLYLVRSPEDASSQPQ